MRVDCTWTLLASMPAARATVVCRARSASAAGRGCTIRRSCKSAVQLCGSSVACDDERKRVGVVDDGDAAAASASSTRPELCSVAGGAASSFWNCSRRATRCSQRRTGPRPTRTTNASRPLNAAQVESATTATPGINCVGLSRPVDLDDVADAGDLACLCRIDLQRAAVEHRALGDGCEFMSGSLTSMPNSGWPVTTLRLSTPLTRVPIRR